VGRGPKCVASRRPPDTRTLSSGGVHAGTTTAAGCGGEGAAAMAAVVSAAGSSGGLEGKAGTAGAGTGADGGGQGSKDISMGALMAAKPREGAEEKNSRVLGLGRRRLSCGGIGEWPNGEEGCLGKNWVSRA
jgi:hypothetical protein